MAALRAPAEAQPRAQSFLGCPEAAEGRDPTSEPWATALPAIWIPSKENPVRPQEAEPEAGVAPDPHLLPPSPQDHCLPSPLFPPPALHPTPPGPPKLGVLLFLWRPIDF